jgi:urocanate reductase
MVKKLLTMVLMIAVALVFGMADVWAGMYKDGTYEASALGRKSKEHSGKVDLKVTIKGDKIEAIDIVTYDQSIDHKKYGPIALEAKDKVPASIIEKQSIDVDGVAKATMSGDAIKLAVASTLHQATVKYNDGTYKGKAMGRKSKGGKDKKPHSGWVEVDVTIAGGKIEKIDVPVYDQSVDHKKYGPLALEAKEKVPAGIIQNQSLDVDAVSKATVSSNAIMIAVAKALEQARAK